MQHDLCYHMESKMLVQWVWHFIPCKQWYHNFHKTSPQCDVLDSGYTTWVLIIFWPSVFRLLSVLFEVLEVMTKKANKWPRKPCNENHEFNCQTLVTLVVAYRDGIFFNWAISLIKINWITVLQSTYYQIINIFLIVCNISMSDDIKHFHSND